MFMLGYQGEGGQNSEKTATQFMDTPFSISVFVEGNL